MAVSGVMAEDRALSLRWLLDELCKAGRLSAETAERVARTPRTPGARLHPLQLLADQAVEDAAHPGHLLNMARLLEWLAQHCRQPLAHIDPLKINVTAVTEVMSFEFAQRHRILALEVTPEKVVVASAEPMIERWELDLEHVVRRPIRRVLADPADIDRYTVEFYRLARSVKGATG
ncbi:MAG: type II/IV secretion system protein, partial [Spongiibacteraceae bacterium]|nr:type II/IV secretion system protein [Spongiibacteraceae bacterium]